MVRDWLSVGFFSLFLYTGKKINQHAQPKKEKTELVNKDVP